MVKLPTASKRSYSAITSIIIGVAIALMISFALSALLTSVVLKGGLKENALNVLVFGIRTISVIIAGLVGSSLAKGKYLPVIGSVTATYTVILTGITIVAFDGSFKQLGIGVVSAVCGGVIACGIKLKPQRKRKTSLRFSR